jgi:predicted XRE-type DNA-binding protein
MTILSPERRAKLEAMRGKPPRLAKVIKSKNAQPTSMAELEETVEKMIALQALGEGLKLARQRRHLTTRQLASALGVSQSRVVHIEQANENLEMQTVARVAKQLGYRVLVQFIPENANEAAIQVNMPQLEANI